MNFSVYKAENGFVFDCDSGVGVATSGQFIATNRSQLLRMIKNYIDGKPVLSKKEKVIASVEQQQEKE
jgi:hypothetical protein